MDDGTFVTETNKTPLIQVITWFLLASAVVCTLFRAYTKWAVIRFIGLDDLFVSLSLVFLIGESVAVTIQTTSGYGKSMAVLSRAQVNTVLQAQYAATLLYIPCLVFSKLPTLVLLNLISPLSHTRRLLIATGVFIVAWAFTAELVAVFQCLPPDTWNYLGERCIDRTAFLSYFEATNAFTDLLLILLPFGVVYRVQTTLRRKISVLSVFSVRLLSIASILTKLILYDIFTTESDPLFTMWPVTICMQVVQFMELMAACILCLRPFLEALTSGFINGDDIRRRGQIRPYFVMPEDVSQDPAYRTSSKSTKSSHNPILETAPGRSGASPTTRPRLGQGSDEERACVGSSHSEIEMMETVDPGLQSVGAAR